jgi:4-amino-4-deoxy-L-arabinose transferase-like glycosyltransferase
MNKLLVILIFVIAIGIAVILPSQGPLAVILCATASLIVLALINKLVDDLEIQLFLRQIFLYGLLFRVFVAILIFSFQLQEFFQPDAIAYDVVGGYLSNSWYSYLFSGEAVALPVLLNTDLQSFISTNNGICYLVGAVYFLVGHNSLAVQMFFAVLGAATSPLIYFCAKQIFNNIKAAKISSIFVALFPSLILWSAQITKDGVIIFFLVLVTLTAINLQKSFSYSNLALLFVGIVGIYFFRPYIFFIVVCSILAGFVIGTQTSLPSIVRRLGVISVLALLLTFSGILGGMSDYIETLGSFEELNRQRSYLAVEGESGYGKDWDVSTPEKALMVLPVAVLYLLFSPFPWQIQNLRQTLTLPEMLMWWGSIPFIIIGLWYTLRNQFRRSVSVLLFLFLLTIFYSLMQGNIGTAYRQRAQLQVFLLMFAAVGWQLLREKRENLQMVKTAKKRHLIYQREQFNKN